MWRDCPYSIFWEVPKANGSGCVLRADLQWCQISTSHRTHSLHLEFFLFISVYLFWLWFASFWPFWERRSDINVRLLTLSEQMNGTKAGDVPSLRHFQEHIFINRTLGGSWHAPNWEGPRNNRLALQTTHTQPAGEALKSIHAQNLRFKNRQRSDATLNHLNSSIRLFTQKHFIDHEHAP